MNVVLLLTSVEHTVLSPDSTVNRLISVFIVGQFPISIEIFVDSRLSSYILKTTSLSILSK